MLFRVHAFPMEGKLANIHARPIMTYCVLIPKMRVFKYWECFTLSAPASVVADAETVQ